MVWHQPLSITSKGGSILRRLNALLSKRRDEDKSLLPCFKRCLAFAGGFGAALFRN